MSANLGVEETTKRNTARDAGRRRLGWLRSALPEDDPQPSWSSLWPRDAWTASAALLLLAVFGAYLAGWARFHWPWLTDLMLQTDDARIQLFPLHRFGPEGALADDEAALDQLAADPPGFVLLYAVLIKLGNLYLASKVVQGLLLAIVVGAGAIVARRKGLGPGLLLVFITIQSSMVTSRIDGGLPRGFGYPLVVLWIAGAIANRGWVRAAATWLGALFYPSAALLMLGGEGVLMTAGCLRLGSGRILARAKRYSLVVAVTVALVVPFSVAQGGRAGPTLTEREARTMELFATSDRLGADERLPIPDPAPDLGPNLVAPFRANGTALAPSLHDVYREGGTTGAVLLFALLVGLALAGASPPPTTAIALSCASLVLFALARAVAYRLYVPVRFLDLGLPMATIALSISAITPLVSSRRGFRGAVPNLVVAVVMVLWWSVIGTGYGGRVGVPIDGRKDRDLYGFVRRLPLDTRIASLPKDGDNIPYWAARATVTSYQTASPWFVDNWRRYDRRTRDTVRALLATRRADLLSYTTEYRVTHLLIRPEDYRAGFRAKIALFEPYRSFALDLVRHHQASDLVLSKVPRQAIVFRKDDRILVDVAKLAQAWGEAGEREPETEHTP
ncbi:MAG: hypothetical protein JW751_31315 [Polyangiaceae bacterium]|nr:hypothetical protein [Polyangiaceae bacterium]